MDDQRTTEIARTTDEASTAAVRRSIVRRDSGGGERRDDWIAVEEPLEIRVRRSGEPPATAAVTMRTPGRDVDLAVGFLLGEGVITDRDDVIDGMPCGTSRNVVHVVLGQHVDVSSLTGSRRFYTTSSCGLCGRSSLDAVMNNLRDRRVAGRGTLGHEQLVAVAHQLRPLQATFARTGAVHCAALATLDGNVLDVAEDVGRHNAVDKVLGRAWLAGGLPGTDRLLFLSGRAGFELVQKAVMAGVSVVAAVGAPSSLAVDLAERAGLTLAGFVGERGFNVYAGGERIDEPVEA